MQCTDGASTARVGRHIGRASQPLNPSMQIVLAPLPILASTLSHSSPSVLPPVQVFLHIVRWLRCSSSLGFTNHSSALILSRFENSKEPRRTLSNNLLSTK